MPVALAYPDDSKVCVGQLVKRTSRTFGTIRVMDISDEQFEALINETMDELPEDYIKRLNNVAIVYEDEPTPDQREKLQLKCHESLFGLYEGIPLTRRGNNYNLVLPDKITIFKKPMTSFARSQAELRAQVKHTLWHEIAHYFGLDHDRIHAIEGKWRR